jgi:predicted ribosomally synthesized peptide with nif11-like leader
MSQSEVERFTSAMKADAALKAEVAGAGAATLATAVAVARRRGYDFTLEEVKAFIVAKARSAGRVLSDTELDALSAGTHYKGCTAPPPELNW